MPSEPWEIWCDVGGTFTDTLAGRSRASDRRRFKLLSSGRVPVRLSEIKPTSCRYSVVDRSLTSDVADFWRTATLRFSGRERSAAIRRTVIRSDSRQLWWDMPLSDSDIEALDSTAGDGDLTTQLPAPVLAAKIAMQTPVAEPFATSVAMRLGTTRGTNALLTRRGAKTALLVTAPFEDVLLIGYGTRSSLFELDIVQPQPLYDCVVGVEERILADGSVELPLPIDACRQQLAHLANAGVESLAISLMNAYARPDHERRLAEIASEFAFRRVVISSQVSPLARYIDRTETTLIDAYLEPVVTDYLAEIAGHLAGGDLLVMTSGGGLVPHFQFTGKDSVLSGPAGGVVALQRLSNSLGEAGSGGAALLGLDMGGTSTDVSRIDGPLRLNFESIKAGVRLLVPSVDIHTVAAGGGSIVAWDGVQWQIGPDSAGAHPGPACYGQGGPLTVTDLNLLTGRLPEHSLPIAADRAAAWTAACDLATAAGVPSDDESVVRLLSQLRRLVGEQMAAAAAEITLATGSDPADHLLVGFGGAAGQHLCDLADILGIATIVDPADAGVLSAVGMGLAQQTATAAESLYTPLDAIEQATMEQIIGALASSVADQLQTDEYHPRWVAQMRTVGTDQTLAIDVPAPTELRWREDWRQRFTQEHSRVFGYLPKRHIELVSFRLIGQIERSLAWRQPSPIDLEHLAKTAADPKAASSSPPPTGQQQIFGASGWEAASVYHRESLAARTSIIGPAVVLSNSHTTVLEAGWIACVCEDSSIVATRQIPAAGKAATSSVVSNVNAATAEAATADVAEQSVIREIVAAKFAAIAARMGLVLEQTAISVNIRQRRDFSCAIFNASGELIANAPHVPVHLGAMQRTVQSLIASGEKLRPGDQWITNDPACGGSHLPDITLIAPVHLLDRSSPEFFVANRAHHAEIGGIVPGSMTVEATRLQEEGVVITLQPMQRGNDDRRGDVERLLKTAAFPSRSPEQNMADLDAQAAANLRGVHAVAELARQVGSDRLQQIVEDVFAASHRKVEAWIASRAATRCSFRDCLDDGWPIAVDLSFDQRRLTIDFSGSGAVHPGNFNAGLGIVEAAVIYTVACMIDRRLPLNAGVLRPIDLVVPPGILNPDREATHGVAPAVAAGNVETSQRIVDVLLGALGAAAASQGTMNNLLLGDASFGFYETIGGGAGATPRKSGASGVHTHMTNTRLTDPEVLEQQYPLILRRCGLRRGSGGRGRHRGGDGIIRQVELRRDLSVSLITSRRTTQPYALADGEPGAVGQNAWIDQAGVEHPLPSSATLQLPAGAQVRLATPGGGGWGE